MFWEFPLKVQAYNSSIDDWYIKTFETQEELTTYVESQFKEPGKYNLRRTKDWKKTGQYYTDTQALTKRPNFEGGKYHEFSRGSAGQKKWMETEKDRVLNGVIYDDLYLPPFYYWYLNFCPIYDDYKKKRRFADVWDGDLFYMQYCMLGILKGKHIGGIKGRQKGISYKHMAILYWSYCWFESSVNTVGAYDEKYVKKSWRFLEGYRSHINAHTTWKRGPTLPKSLEWNESQADENNIPRGLMSKLAGVTFKQNPENDVGGSQTFFNYEEPGVSPTILKTLEFVRPALEKGSVTTGIMIACGSVGELEDAEGMKKIFYHPDDYNFLGIKNIWDEDAGPDDICGIFISEAYNMIGTDKKDKYNPEGTGRSFMDADGNSDVELSLTWIRKMAEKLKTSTKAADLKQLATSQKCTSPKQAFAERTISEFPVEKLRKQQERILLKEQENLWEYKPQKGLFTEEEGKVIMVTTNLPREHEYPIKPDWEDKRGVWTIYEPPDPGAEMFTYFACVDAIEVDFTETSESVASVDIFKTAVEVTYIDKKGKKQTRLEGDKLVATYRGRFNTPDETNHQIWLGIKLYNAFTYAERNKPNFINYMRRLGKAERYLAKESDVPLFKDLNIKNGNVANNSKFGFHKGDNTEVWKYFKAATKEYFSAEYGRSTFMNGELEETLRVFTGIDRIDDYWLLEEFCKYVEGKGNYDRMVSFMGALFICKIYQQNRFIKRRNEVKEVEKKEKPLPKIINALTGGYYNPGRQPNRTKGSKRPYSML